MAFGVSGRRSLRRTVFPLFPPLLSFPQAQGLLGQVAPVANRSFYPSLFFCFSEDLNFPRSQMSFSNLSMCKYKMGLLFSGVKVTCSRSLGRWVLLTMTGCWCISSLVRQDCGEEPFDPSEDLGVSLQAPLEKRTLKKKCVYVCSCAHTHGVESNVGCPHLLSTLFF